VSPVVALALADGAGGRLGLALALVAGLAVLGWLIRELFRTRLGRIATAVRLDPTNTGRPRLITFTGPCCASCHAQLRIVEELRSGWPGGFEVEEVDAIEQPDRARRFGVVLVPVTAVAAADGRIVAINAGLADAARLAAQLGAATGVPGRAERAGGTRNVGLDGGRADAA
jgi:thiol-disulfide isomerase/thioredoxin